MPRQFLLAVTLVSIILSPAVLCARILDDVFDDGSNQPYAPFVELNGYGGDFPETGTTFLFAPLWQTEDEMFFADLRGLYNDLAEAEGNWGLGYRRIINDDTIFGVYGFYDQRFTEWNNRYHQATLGMELLRVENEARWNVYIPDDNQELAYANAFLQNNQVYVQGIYEAAYFGTDFEYGQLLYANPSRSVEVRGYAGGYVFDRGEDGYQSLSGPRTRAEMRVYDLPALGNGSRLVVGGVYQHDEARGHQGIAYASLRIALGQKRKLSGIQRRMINPIVRDVDIITNVGGLGPKDPAKFVSTGTMASSVALIDGATADPESVFANAGSNSVVLFNGDKGNITTATGFAFNNGQEAYGGGSLVMGCNTGLIARLGARPTIVGTNTMADVFTLANNNVIAGLNITGGDNGIIDPDGGTHQIIDNRVSGTLGNALLAQFIVGNITGNSFDGNGGHGLIAYSITGNITGNSFDGNDGDGLIAYSITGDTTANSFNGNGGNGLIANSITGDITGNTANGNGNDKSEHGIAVMNGVDGSVTNNTANDNFGDGIHIAGGVTGDISGNTTNNNDPGLYVLGGVGGNVSGNTANDNAGAGIYIDGSVGGTLDNNTTLRNAPSNPFDHGIEVTGDVGTGLMPGDDAVFNNRSEQNNNRGVRIGGSVFGNVSRNNFSHNGDAGFVVLGSLIGDVTDNTSSGSINEDGFLVFGDLVGNVTNNTFENNAIYGLRVFGDLVGDVSNNTFNYNVESGLAMANLIGNVSGNDFSGSTNDFGLLVIHDMTGNITNNTFNNNADGGVFIIGNLMGDVAGNSFNGNTADGFEVLGLLDGNVTENTANGNTGNGFIFDDVLMGNLFDSNTANGNGEDGFNFGDNKGTFTNNTANDNGDMGYDGTNSGTAANNTGSGNTNGGNTFP